MIKCPSCNGTLKFNIEKQNLKCDYCNSEYKVGSVKNGDDADDFYYSNIFTCPDCGAEILSDDDTAITFCSYCGNEVTLEGRLSRLKKPKLIIPFKITKQDCESRYKKLVKRAFFAPSEMVSESKITKLRGIYMPYWVYNMTQSGVAKIKKAHERHRSGDYTVVNNYTIEVDYDAEFRGLSYDAAAAFPDPFSNSIAPFQIATAVEFDEGYIAGFYADAGDIEAAVYKEQALNFAGKYLSDNIRRKSELRRMTYKEEDVAYEPSIDNSSDDMAYMPVYFLANQFGDKVSYAVINGQTGEVAADIPIDYKKYLIGSLLLTLPLFVILNFFLTQKPSMLLLITMLFAVISLFMLNRQMDLIFTRSNYLDDIGRQVATYGSAQKLNGYKERPKFLSSLKDLSGMSLNSITITVIVLFLLSLLGFVNIIVIVGAFLYFGGDTISRIISDAVPVGATKTPIVIKQPLSQKMPVLIRPVISIVLCVFILVLDPTMDYWFYGGTIATMVLVLWSIFDMVKGHNLLTLRTPAQLNRRGGDES